jgi:hypothetical protein
MALSLVHRVVAVIRPRLSGCRCAERLLELRAHAIAGTLLDTHGVEWCDSPSDDAKILAGWEADWASGRYVTCRAAREQKIGALRHQCA